MRIRLLPLTAFALAGALGCSSLALAQPAPGAPPAPPAHAMSAPAPAPFGPMHRPGMGPGMGMGSEMHGHHWAGGPHHWMDKHDGARRAFLQRAKTWGLFSHHADLALSPSDVQTIAEAILLRHGEHDWKVGDVTPNADHTVSFAFVTAHGDVIARFTMNTVTGRITRTD